MRIAPKMFFTVAVMLTADVALAAPVAVLSETSGQVSVQTSDGIVTARRGTQLSEGDRLAVGDGSAIVSFLRGKCKGDREIGARSITVISTSAKECSKRIEGAKAQSLDQNLGQWAAPAALLAAGGIAAGIALPSNGGGGNTVLLVISP